MKTIILVAVLALSACAMTPEQRVVHMLKTYGPACQKLGFEADSDQHRNCLMKMDDYQQAESLRASAAVAAANSTFQSVFQAGQIK